MNNKGRRAWLDWLIGAGTATALIALIVLFGDMRFSLNDDIVMLRPLMGFETTEIPDFQLYLHTIIAYPLRWLSLAVPETPWYSYMLIAFDWLACAIAVKCITALFARHGHSRAWGALAGVLYAALFSMVYSCRVTYTITAAMLGAAAVLQVMSADFDREGGALRPLLFALVPLSLAYGLRQLTAVPIAAFCLLALAYRLMRAGGSAGLARALKPACAFLIVAAVLFGALIGGRELEIRLKHKEDYLHWQRARIGMMDYYDFSELTDEELAEIGWTRAEQRLITLWYFIDENITAEAFETAVKILEERNPRGVADKLYGSVALIGSLPKVEPTAWLSALAVFGAVGFCAISLIMRRRGVMWQWLCLSAGAALAAALLLYLGYKGRLPLRAALMAFMPFAAMVFGLAPDCLPEAGEVSAPKLSALLIAGACVLALGVRYAVPAAGSIRKPETDEYETNAFADLDEYADLFPEYLIIYDDTFASDSRMFPTTENGTPANVMFWGGWSTHSDEYNSRLEAFGIDPEHADVSIFLREDVRLARGVVEGEPTELYEYLCEKTGQDVSIMMDMDWGGAHMLCFYGDE